MSTSDLLPKWYRPRVGLPLGRWLGLGLLVGSATAACCVWATAHCPATVRAAHFGSCDAYRAPQTLEPDNCATTANETMPEPNGMAIPPAGPTKNDGGVQMKHQQVDSGNR
jgi:hypothetical protein